MKKFLTSVLKAGALFFVVGALLAVAAPYIGAAVGLAPTAAEAATALGHSASPIWMGAFFGAFGAIDAAVRPTFDWAFGSKGGAEAGAVKTAEPSAGKQVNITIVQSPQQSQAQVVAESSHRQTIEAERLAMINADKTTGL